MHFYESHKATPIDRSSPIAPRSFALSAARILQSSVDIHWKLTLSGCILLHKVRSVRLHDHADAGFPAAKRLVLQSSHQGRRRILFPNKEWHASHGRSRKRAGCEWIDAQSLLGDTENVL